MPICVVCNGKEAWYVYQGYNHCEGCFLKLKEEPSEDADNGE